jgi:heme/copper-type cytochrome/quinol oxidase subunit 2
MSTKTLLIAMAAVAFSLGGAGSVAVADATPRTVELVATGNAQFKLAGGKKGPLVLKAGERVMFKITAQPGATRAKDGSVHSFTVRKLKALGWDVRLKEGVQEFTLTAPPPGEYTIECTVFCGGGHDDMNLKMVVE